MPQYQFRIPRRGAPDNAPALSVFVFDRRGKLLAQAPLADGVARLSFDPRRAGAPRLLIAPTPKPSDRSPTLETLKRWRAYQPPMRFRANVLEYELRPIPLHYWKWWVWCPCHVIGQVVKPVEHLQSTTDMPVCHARVHICEVDPFWMVLPRLPDPLVLRVRDELLRLLEPPRPEPRIPRLPFPRPFPRPPFPQPSFPQPSFPQPVSLEVEAPRHLEFENTGIAALRPRPLAPALPAIPDGLRELPAPFRTALSSNSPRVLRQHILKHSELMVPLLCRWPWIWPFLRCDEITVVETDENGRFDAMFFYPCAGDKPDLYFWVEYCVGGTWTTVYRPPLPCNIEWNYNCGEEVTLRVTDPRVPWCGELPTVEGTAIGVITIGNKINVNQLAADGLYNGAPLGGSLEPAVWFGDGLAAAGITHYRWSYRRLGTSPADPWHVVDAPVGRHYGVVTPGGDLIFKSYPLGPDNDVPAQTLFKIPPASPPEGSWAPQVNARANTASARFRTGDSSPPDFSIVEDGLYQLKLELFRVSGTGSSMVVAQATGLDFKVPPANRAAPFPTDQELPMVTPPESMLIRNGSGQVTALTLKVKVDNNPCEAAIYDPAVPGSTQECGFFSYPDVSAPAPTITLSFLAHHPNQYATFRFDVSRARCSVAQASVAPAVALTSSATNGYAHGSGDRFTKQLAIASLLGSLGPSCSTVCSKAAFAERVHVYATATDGWSRLRYLDASALAAFALAPAE